MAIKTVYTFTVDKEVEVEKEEVVDGGTLIKKIKENKPIKFAIRKPNRVIADDNDLFYSVQFNEAIKKKLMPRALLAKRLNNDDGIFSDAQIAEQEKLSEEFLSLSNELVLYAQKKEEEYSEEEKTKATEALEKYNNIRQILNEYENAKQSVFENSAESRARIKAIGWYALFLSYKENDKKELEPLYSGETYEEKLESYDKIVEESDSCILKAIFKFSHLVSAFALNRASSEADFQAIEKTLE